MRGYLRAVDGTALGGRSEDNWDNKAAVTGDDEMTDSCSSFHFLQLTLQQEGTRWMVKC